MPAPKFHVCQFDPPGYAHGGVFTELVDLLQHALQQAGCEVSRATNRVVRGRRNILVGVHMADAGLARQLPRDTIVLNTEQLPGTPVNWWPGIEGWLSSGLQVWDYSRRNIDAMRAFGVQDARLLRLGYQPELRRITRVEPATVDILFYGSMNERRRSALQAMADRGLRVKHLFGVYGAQRDGWIARSRLVLNLHFHAVQIFEVVRVFYLLTNAAAVLAEVNPGTEIEAPYGEGVAAAPYGQLVDRAVELLSGEARLQALRERGFQAIARHPQVEYMRELID